MVKKLLAITLSLSLLFISFGVPQAKASAEITPSIQEAISNLPCGKEVKGLVTDLFGKYSKARPGMNERVLAESISRIGDLLLKIKPMLREDQLNSVMEWVCQISPEVLADLDERSFAQLIKVINAFIPTLLSNILDAGLDLDVVIEEWFPGVSLDDVIYLLCPRGDYGEYVKGAPKRYCWLGLLGPWTGPEGGFMADAAPLLGWVSLFLGGGIPNFKGVMNMDFYLADTRGEAVTGIASFEKWASKPHRSPLLIAWGPEATLYDLKGKGAIGFNPGGPSIERQYRHENWVSSACLAEEASADLVRYMLMEWPKETGKPQPQKIGILVQSGGILTSRWYESMFRDFMVSDLYKLLLSEFEVDVEYYTFPSTASDCTPQLIRLRDAGVEWIFNAATTSSAAVIAKSAKSLGLKDVQFAANVYGMDHSVISICRPSAVEGWIAAFNGVSMDDPNPTTEERRGQIVAQVAAGMVGMEIPPATIGIQEPCTVIAGVRPLLSCLDRVEGWANCDDITPEMYMEEYFKLCGGSEPYWEPITSMHPITLLPGRTSSIWTVMVDVRGGKLYEHTRRDGKRWQWVPPKTVPGPGPCPPNGWVAPPLEGSIDYGPPWGEWTFDRFVTTYDPPLWWLLLEYGAPRSDNVMHKDLFFSTLDKYFEAEGMDRKQAKELIQENLDMYHFPGKWVGWFNEYLRPAPPGPCLPCG